MDRYQKFLKIIGILNLKRGLSFIIILALLQAIFESLVILIIPNIFKTLIFNESTLFTIKDFSFDLKNFHYLSLILFSIEL